MLTTTADLIRLTVEPEYRQAGECHPIAAHLPVWSSPRKVPCVGELVTSQRWHLQTPSPVVGYSVVDGYLAVIVQPIDAAEFELYGSELD